MSYRFYKSQIVTDIVCTDNITLGHCTRWMLHYILFFHYYYITLWKNVTLLLLKGHMGREHGDAQECSKIYVLKYTECHPPASIPWLYLVTYDWLLGTSTPWLYFVTYVWSVETWSVGASTLAILHNVWLIVRNLHTLAILYNVWLIRRKPPHHAYIHYNVCLIRRNLIRTNFHPWHDWIQIVVFQKGRDLWCWNFCQ